MSFEQVKVFFKDLQLWQKVAAGVIVLIIGAILRFLWPILKRKRPEGTSSVIGPITTGSNSQTQVATGDGITQNIVVDKSMDRGVHIKVEPGAQAVINVIDYQDGIFHSTITKVKTLFDAARNHYIKRNFADAIEKFKRCLDLEIDPEKRGALNLQIGNCYYKQHHYLKAAEFYGAGLTESRQANDKQGQASILIGIGNTYLMRPASSGSSRGNNVREAVNHYKTALQIFDKDEYPVQYAMTQNNLGTAYTDLPAATPEQRAQNVRNAIDCYKAALEIYKKGEYPVDYAITQNNPGNAYTDLPAATPEQRAQNVRNAIDCYKAALEIRKKDEYPQSYCFTAANMGLILLEMDDKNAIYWLKEAYSVREFLPDQGKSLEEVINRVCDQE